MGIGRRARTGAVVVALAVAAALTGCGTTSDAAGVTAVATTTTTATTATTTAAGPTSAVPPTTEGASVDLEAVLPKLADLPEGWTKDPDREDGEDEPAGPDASCEEADPISLEHSTGNALVSFTQEAASTYLLAGVIEFPDETVADEGIDAYRSFVARCDGYLFDEDDPTSAVSFEDLDFPHLGDTTYASQFRASTSLSDFAVSTVLTRVGPRVAVISYGGVTVQDLDLLEALQRAMVGRL